MFTCVCSKYVWAIVKEALNWERTLVSIEDFFVNWIGGNVEKENKLKMFGLGVVCWSPWLTRNKMAIEKKIIKSPSEIVFKAYHSCSNGVCHCRARIRRWCN